MRLFARSFPKVIRPIYRFSISQLSKAQVMKKYKENPSFALLKKFISHDTCLGSNIFQMFQIMYQSPYEDTVYRDFYNEVKASNEDRPDNLCLLLSKVKLEISKYQQRCGNISKAIQEVEESLQMAEQCIIPPMLPFYQAYMYYGVLLYVDQQEELAEEVLVESVRIIDEFVKESGDQPYFNQEQMYVRMRAVIALADLERDQFEGYIAEADRLWGLYEGNKYHNDLYATEVLLKVKYLMGKAQQAEAKQKDQFIWKAKEVAAKQGPLLINMELRAQIDSVVYGKE